MTSAISAILASLLYGAAALMRGTERPKHLKPQWLTAIAGTALLFHGVAAARMVMVDGGISFSLWPMSVMIFFVVNLTVVLSSLRKPVQSLYLPLFPASALVLLVALVYHHSGQGPAQHLSLELGLHVVLSLLAYSLLTIAAGQSLVLAYQNYQLKHHHPGGFLKGLPPLQTMEALLFEMLWAGFILLTLALATGFAFIEDLWAQHLAHKTFFSLVGWVTFATLLFGRHRLGWRGYKAIRWTLGGFGALALAYWGSKFVLQVILGVNS